MRKIEVRWRNKPWFSPMREKYKREKEKKNDNVNNFC